MSRRIARLARRRIREKPLAATLSSVGGCTFAEDPGQSCAEVLPMWSGAVNACVLSARAQPDHGNSARVFDARSDATRILIGPGREHLLVDRGAELIRLDIVEGTVFDGPVLLHFDLADDGCLERRIAAIRALRSPAPSAPRYNRLANRLLALQAVDVRNAGGSLRETADILLGPGDWPGDGDHRKSRVRRLCDLGRAMIEAGPSAILNEPAC